MCVTHRCIKFSFRINVNSLFICIVLWFYSKATQMLSPTPDPIALDSLDYERGEQKCKRRRKKMRAKPLLRCRFFFFSPLKLWLWNPGNLSFLLLFFSVFVSFFFYLVHLLSWLRMILRWWILKGSYPLQVKLTQKKSKHSFFFVEELIQNQHLLSILTTNITNGIGSKKKGIMFNQTKIKMKRWDWKQTMRQAFFFFWIKVQTMNTKRV